MIGMTVREIRQQCYDVTFSPSVVSLDCGIGIHRIICVVTQLSWLRQAIIRLLLPMQLRLASLHLHHINLMQHELMTLWHLQNLK